MGFEPMTSSILVHLSLQFKYMIFYIFTCIEIVFFAREEHERIGDIIKKYGHFLKVHVHDCIHDNQNIVTFLNCFIVYRQGSGKKNLACLSDRYMYVLISNFAGPWQILIIIPIIKNWVIV